MAVPSHNYMILDGGTNSSNTNIYTSDNSGTQNLIKVGDAIRITGTANNNGVFTVTDITTDGTALGSNGDVYYSLKGANLTNESSAGSTDPSIEVIRAPGDKLIALGDVDGAGSVDVWSNNATTDYVGISPASADGWTESAITPTLDGGDAKYIFHFADEALRVCNINENNTSIIKWYGYIQKQQFSNNLGLTFSEWQEHPNTLAPPLLAEGAFTYAYGTSASVTDNACHLGTTEANYYKDNRGVAKVKEFTDGSDLRFRANTGKMADMLSPTQKAFLLDVLDDDDGLFDFGGNTSDGDGDMEDVVTKGFICTNAGFVVHTGTGRLVNTTSSKGTAYLRFITEVGKKYQVSVDVASSSNASGSVSLSTSTSYDSTISTGALSSSGVTNASLSTTFTATGASSYLHLRVDSTTDTEYCNFDNLTIRAVGDISFENTSSVAVLDQCTVGEVITIGEALGTYPKEALFCTKVSGGSGGPITYQGSYGGGLIGTAPHIYNDEDTPIIERGIGFNIGVSEVDSVSTASPSGQWEAGTYEFYQTFVYDSEQESLPLQMGDGAATTSLAAFNAIASGDRSFVVSVYADVFYNGRISGGRIYTRLKDTDDDLVLFADIDIVKGVRLTIDGGHSPWVYDSADEDGYYVSNLISENPNLDTYNTINGFSPDIHFNAMGGRNEIYKTSIISNRRAFIANVKIKGSNIELQKHGDRIMYSELGKFDTFPEHNFIDVSKGDYGEYVMLESYADRLLAFKHNLVHVINISSPSVANWFLEDTIKHFGVNHKFSVTKTNNGVAWLSDNGCYLYNGETVNLLGRKLAVSSPSYTGTNVNWQAWYRGTANIKDVMLGYDPISNSLIMFRSPDDNSDYSNTGWIYDFDTDGWAYHTKIFTDSENYTNFITDWNNNLTLGYTDASSNTSFSKFLPVSKSLQNQEFVTRDIDFGHPGIVKKIYKVTVTYRSDASVTTPFTYAIDGKQDFSSSGGGTFTGNFADTSDKWDIVTLTPSSTISCQSIQIKFANGSSDGIFEVNDMSIQYRAIGNKEAT